MSASTYLASSKEIILPDEINDYYNRRIFDEPNISMSIFPTEPDDPDIDHLRKIMTMPYIYHIGGLGSAIRFVEIFISTNYGFVKD